MSRELAIHGELALAGEYDGRRTPLPSFRDSHPSSQRVALRNLVHKAPQEHDAESGNRRLGSKKGLGLGLGAPCCFMILGLAADACFALRPEGGVEDV